MRAIGVIEDGFAFSEAALRRGTPRLWWGARKRSAYRRVLLQRGAASTRRDGQGDASSPAGSGDGHAHGQFLGGAAAAALMVSDIGETKAAPGASSCAGDGVNGTSDSSGPAGAGSGGK